MKALSLISFCLLSLSLIAGQSVRKPFDDVSYAWKEIQIEKLIETVNKMGIKYNRVDGNITAAIFPHDDHLYSGFTVNALVSQIKKKKLAIIFGVTHKTPIKIGGKISDVIILDNYAYWYSPYQNIKVSSLREFVKENLKEKYYIVSNTYHSYEHSIEAILPFLSYYNRGIEIMPVMVTPMDLKTMDKISNALSKVITNYLEKNSISLKDVVFLISADANHYGEDFNNTTFGKGEEGHKRARQNDLEIFKNYLKGEITVKKVRKIVKDRVYEKALWCGRYSIPFGLLTTEKIIEKTTKKHLFGEFIHYDDTYIDPMVPLKGYGFGVSAPFSLKHWVGHMAVGFVVK